jgi:hypothetical protein
LEVLTLRHVTKNVIKKTGARNILLKLMELNASFLKMDAQQIQYMIICVIKNSRMPITLVWYRIRCAEIINSYHLAHRLKLMLPKPELLSIKSTSRQEKEWSSFLELEKYRL